MPARTFDVDEEETFVYTATIEDEVGNAITLSNISSLYLTLYNQADQAIINSRNGQNVLNRNNVTVATTGGTLTWTSVEADTAMQDSALSTENHVAIFRWQWGSNPIRTNRHEVIFRVRNLGQVPDAWRNFEITEDVTSTEAITVTLA